MQMESNLGKSSVMAITNREEDDDLEALRLAALLSRKSAKEQTVNGQNHNIPSSGFLSGGKKPFPGAFHDNHRNNNSNSFPPSSKWSRQRSSNLIVINPVPLEEPKVKKVDPPPKLVLPQDKWCPRTSADHEKPVTESSGPGKFSRIRYQSDNSDSEDSESELDKSDDKSSTRDAEESSNEDLITSVENESSSDILVTQEQDSLSSADEDCESDNGDSCGVDENVENVAKDTAIVRNEQPSTQAAPRRLQVPVTREFGAENEQESQKNAKKSIDLREVLKAKRDVKNNSDYDSDEDKESVSLSPSPLKSVLGVVKQSPHRSNDLSKKLTSRLHEKKVKVEVKDNKPSGRSVFLTLDQPVKRLDNVNSDSMQVTVVTGAQEEKKYSVHMRLGPKGSSAQSTLKTKVPVTSRLGPCPATLLKRGTTQDRATKDQGRRRRCRSSSGTKRSHVSGFRDSKENEQDAKIRRIEKISTVRR